MMERKICLIIIAFLLLPLSARGQFYHVGTDPGRLKWNSIETPNYQVIYPQGADSLARGYARTLERFRVPSGYSIGLTPGDLQWNKLPVVLHPFYGYSNGSVPWAPSRMDLYTVMPPLGGDPVPWEIQLLSHEPRHQAQWQMGFTGLLKPFSYLTGEAASPLGFLFYLDLALAEGDAVATETGYGYGTRARTADFLDYYRMALDQGDFRSWDRWRYGSYKHYTPDYYTLGYLTIGGVRYFYDYPLFTADFLARSRKKPFSFTQRNMKKTASERSGKPFKETFADILQGLNQQWQQEAEARAPFIPQEQLTHASRLPRFYSSTAVLGDNIFLLRNDNARGKELVTIRDGKEDILAPMAAGTQALWPDENFLRLYWAETVADVRWELSHRSILRYYDASRDKIFDLTKDGRLYNPRPSADGLQVLAVEYPWQGGSKLVTVSALDGSVLQKILAPDGIQATEATWWKDGSFYVFGISEGGTGLYQVTPDGQWSMVLEPGIQKTLNLCSGDGYLEWISDLDGSNELYRYFPEEGRLVQRTSARYGLTDAVEKDGFLYYVAQTLEGTQLFRTPLEALQPREKNYADVHTYPMEEALVAQERFLGPVPSADAPVEISEPRRYSKLGHLFRFHTWLPFYVNYDALEQQSMDFSYETASLGLTGFFQNTLSSMYGYVGYSAHPDTEKGVGWTHSLHGKLTYTGLLPVLEAAFDLGGNPRQYYLNQYSTPNSLSLSTSSYLREDALFSFRLNAYVPLRFNKGGMLAGLVPKLSYTFSNSGYSNRKALWEAPDKYFANLPARYRFVGIQEGINAPLRRLSGSLRGYWMLPTAEAGVYPRLGIGAETGLSFRPGLTGLFAPVFYLYGYGYLPGLWLPQGLRITGMYQQQLQNKDLRFGELYASVLPRGFSLSAGSIVAQNSPSQFRVTADYAIPIYVGDLSLGPVTYIKNFLLTPHFDFTGLQDGNLWSAGVDLTAEIGHLFFFHFDGSLGVSFSYLGGSWYENVAEGKPFSVSMIFSFDI